MKSPLYFLVLFSAGFACSRNTVAKTSRVTAADTVLTVVSSAPEQKTAGCIAEKIDSIKKLPLWNPPAEIDEYEMDGRKVYLISADCCDRFTTVVDENCNYLCAPSGGFTGRGDGKCREFFNQAKLIRLVWKDERAR